MKNWQSLLIDANATISMIIKALDKGAQGILLVVSTNQKLLGTITDGDVRRALIRHMNMECPASEIMCKTPKTAKADWSKDLILSTMEKHQLLHLPVLDDHHKIIGLETLHDLVSKPRYDNPVLLIAGGFGTRLHPLTKDCPKPLLKIDKKPILEHILERFVDAGFHRFYISTHFMPEMIQNHFQDGGKWGISIHYVHEQTPLGTAGSLGLLPKEEMDVPFIMMNGDLLTNLNFQHLLAFHESNDGIATMCVREYEHSVPYGVIQSDGHQVISIVEKPQYKFFINAGIYVISPQLLLSIKSGCHMDMPHLLEQQIKAGKSVKIFPIHEYWIDVGRFEDFQKAQNEIKVLA